MRLNGDYPALQKKLTIVSRISIKIRCGCSINRQQEFDEWSRHRENEVPVIDKSKTNFGAVDYKKLISDTIETYEEASLPLSSKSLTSIWRQKGSTLGPRMVDDSTSLYIWISGTIDVRRRRNFFQLWSSSDIGPEDQILMAKAKRARKRVNTNRSQITFISIVLEPSISISLPNFELCAVHQLDST